MYVWNIIHINTIDKMTKTALKSNGYAMVKGHYVMCNVTRSSFYDQCGTPHFM